MLAGKFKASNKLNQEAFQDYIKYFIKKNRAGIIFTNLYLIYLLPPKDDLHLPYKLKQNELLALFFKIKNWLFLLFYVIWNFMWLNLCD